MAKQLQRPMAENMTIVTEVMTVGMFFITAVTAIMIVEFAIIAAEMVILPEFTVESTCDYQCIDCCYGYSNSSFFID